MGSGQWLNSVRHIPPQQNKQVHLSRADSQVTKAALLEPTGAGKLAPLDRVICVVLLYCMYGVRSIVFCLFSLPMFACLFANELSWS